MTTEHTFAFLHINQHSNHKLNKSRSQQPKRTCQKSIPHRKLLQTWQLFKCELHAHTHWLHINEPMEDEAHEPQDSSHSCTWSLQHTSADTEVPKHWSESSKTQRFFVNFTSFLTLRTQAYKAIFHFLFLVFVNVRMTSTSSKRLIKVGVKVSWVWTKISNMRDWQTTLVGDLLLLRRQTHLLPDMLVKGVWPDLAC